MFALVALIGSGMWLVQEQFDLWLGVSISGEEVFIFDIVYWGVLKFSNKRKLNDKFTDIF